MKIAFAGVGFAMIAWIVISALRILIAYPAY